MNLSIQKSNAINNIQKDNRSADVQPLFCAIEYISKGVFAFKYMNR